MARFDENTGERLDPPDAATKPQPAPPAELRSEPAKPAENKPQAPVATKEAPSGGRR